MKKLSKKLLSAILSVLMVFSVFYAVPLTATAAEIETAGVGNTCGDYKYNKLSDGTAEITDYTGSANKLDIPSALDGYAVTGIGSYAFENCTSLESVTISEGVESIGYRAFCGCTSLESIMVADGNSNYCSVDGVLFSKDKTVLICYPGGKSGSYTIFSSVTSIGSNAFCGCTSLESVIIPSGVTSIGSNAFSDCTSLESITIPEGVTSIDCGTFENCTSLRSIAIPAGITTIDLYAFKNCTLLESVTIPEGVMSIDESAFSDCTSLTGITIPEGVERIGDRAFENCTSLRGIVIPESVKSIGGCVFENCSSLKSVVIPSGVTSIGNDAFSGCSSLESITIPEGVTSIDNCAFWGCPLKDVYYTGSESQWESIDINDGNEALELATIYYNDVSSGNISGDYKYEILDDGTALITRYTGSATQLDIPSALDGYAVTSIGSYAFENCTSLESVTIPEGITNIGNGAFWNCPLKDVYYTGNESQWESMDIDDGYDALKDASIHYNYVPSENTEPDLLPGDANGDGVVNVKDATTVQKHIAGLITLEGEALAVADYDNNGTVNVKDATAIQKHVAGLI